MDKVGRLPQRGIDAVIVFDVAVDPSQKEHLLAGTNSGVYEKKRGTYWERLTTEWTRALAFHPLDSTQSTPASTVRSRNPLTVERPGA